jgi:PAS domain S-box-containing protein
MTTDFTTAIWEQNPDAIIVADSEGTILRWNPAAERIFGYTAAQAQGRTLGELVVPDALLSEDRDKRACAARDGIALYEGVRRRKDGARVHVSVSVCALAAVDGTRPTYLYTKKDVTHLKVLRDAKLVEARFRDLLESTPDAIVLVNVTGRIVMVNSQAETLFGYAHDRLHGQPVEVLLPPRFRHAHLKHRAMFFEQPRTRTMGAGLELYGLRESGQEFPVEISLSPLQTEEGTMVMSAIRDITGRKKADKKFRDLLESAPDAMVIAKEDGAMVLVNHQAVQLFGWTREEMLGNPIEMLVPLRLRAQHPAHRRGFFTQPRARAMGVGLDLYGLRKDGTEFPVEISLSPLETEEGQFVSSAIRDVTDRRRIEQALREKNLELENAAIAKDRFFAGMSHELRTPLNAVIGFTGTLMMQLPGPLNAEQTRQLQLVQTAAQHLLSLINDLLDVAKLDADRLELYPESFDCCELLNELAATLMPQAQRKGLEFALQLPPQPHPVQADRRALSQIIINLMANAIKFTERGEVALCMRAIQLDDHPQLEISVRDTGPGISEQDQLRLFQPFSQLGAIGRRSGEGTGLGLHLSQRLAEAMGGRLVLQSAPGTGSTFILNLPAV